MKKLIISLSITGVILLIVTVGAYGTAVQQISEYNSPTIQAAEKPKVIPLPLATDIEAGINQYRASQGRSILNSEVVALDQAAQARAEQMCTANDWSHNQDWIILAPYYTYAYAGENLYYGFLQDNQATVAVQAWIASPTHQENMVDNYNEMGIAVKACPGFQNEPTAVIITNYFGVPQR